MFFLRREIFGFWNKKNVKIKFKKKKEWKKVENIVDFPLLPSFFFYVVKNRVLGEKTLSCVVALIVKKNIK